MITNCWGQVPVKRIAVEEGLVYEGRPGTGYNHQAQLTTHQGALVATWTLGIRDEEGPAEDMVFAVSEDQGKTWSPPKVIACAQPGRTAKTVEVSSGLLSIGDAMVAFNGHWDRAEGGVEPDGFRTRSNDPDNFLDVRTEARVSRDGGTTWSAPVVVAPNLSNYMTPFRTASGRLILPGNLTFPWTDDPMGLTGWHWAGVPGLTDEVKDNYFNMGALNAQAETGYLYNEACCYQLADGMLRMLFRNESDRGRLGVSESRDNGLTWSKPVLTDYSEVIARAHFGRLPDGRYFGMNCPRPRYEQEGRRHRTPAVLALSVDGDVFDQHFLIGDDAEGKARYEGLYKHGRYGYPYLHVDGEFGYVIYSVNKEDICVSRFRLEDLSV